MLGKYAGPPLMNIRETRQLAGINRYGPCCTILLADNCDIYTKYNLEVIRCALFVISIFLFTYQSCTLTAELKTRTQVFLMRFYRRLLNILYTDHKDCKEVHRESQEAIEEYDEFLTLDRRGGQKRKWKDNIYEWTGIASSSARVAENRTR